MAWPAEGFRLCPEGHWGGVLLTSGARLGGAAVNMAGGVTRRGATPEFTEGQFGVGIETDLVPKQSQKILARPGFRWTAP